MSLLHQRKWVGPTDIGTTEHRNQYHWRHHLREIRVELQQIDRVEARNNSTNATWKKWRSPFTFVGSISYWLFRTPTSSEVNQLQVWVKENQANIEELKTATTNISQELERQAKNIRTWIVSMKCQQWFVYILYHIIHTMCEELISWHARLKIPR